jgi:hypothetical protein
MITQLSSQANTSELNGIASNFNSIISKSETKDAALLKLNTSLKTSNADLTQAIDKKLGSDKTDHIWELEGLRDDSLRAFFITIHGCSLRQNAAVKEAGLLIREVINRHGRTMYQLPHLEQTSKMDALFTELALPAMTAALQTTQTAVIVDETKKANQDFLDAVNERTNADVTKEEIALVAAARKPVKTGLEKIMNYLSSVIPQEEAPELEIIYNSLSKIITEANSVIKTRLTLKENKKKEQEKKS